MTSVLLRTIVFMPVTLSGAVCQSTVQNSDKMVWADPNTGLVWAAKDNGEDISWKAARKYCRHLKLDGLTDCRMPSTSEAQSIFDKRVQSPGIMGIKRYGNVDTATWHVKGGIFLTGTAWIAAGDQSPKCVWTCYAPHFDFNEGRVDQDPVGWPYPYDGRRALCVRGSQVSTKGANS